MLNRSLKYLTILLIVAPCSAFAADPNDLTEQQIRDGWIRLFDGETLFGWREIGNAKWQAANGVIRANPQQAGGWLLTTTPFSDFVLQLQYRISEGGNSGLCIRSAPEGDPAYVGYEMQINDRDQNNPTGSLYNLVKARHPESGLATSVETWQDVEILAVGDYVQVTLNGVRVIADTVRKHERGVIGMQYHHDNMWIEFRGIRLKPLGAKALFNGRDLQGWYELPDHASEFKVAEGGVMKIEGGGGQIETVGLYADFVLQMDIQTHGEGLNSGVFFRGVPHKFWSGYESQIRNQWEGEDRTKPVDFGTGGFYAQQPARRVVSNDNEWFTKTIVASENHFAVWVNGTQVSDWTDSRDANEEARAGLRLDAGTISLQGHDPSTDLSFRDIRLLEFPARR